jgi:hypothetical protein
MPAAISRTRTPTGLPPSVAGEQAEGQLLEIRYRAGELAADVTGRLAVQPGQQLVYRLQLLPRTRAEPGILQG